jgi:hypothetical protein
MPNDGDFMVTKTGGFVAWCIRKVTKSTVNHAAVYIGVGFIVEAQSNGAVISPVSKYPDAVWSTAPNSYDDQHKLRLAALDLVGTPYNFLDIAAQLFVRQFGWNAPKWAIKRLSSPKRLQCAQLVDEAYRRAGITLFKDGRPAGLVAPSDLLALIEAQHGETDQRAA